MADNLIFPIKFDLEKGVKDALTDGDKALDRIAKALEKHPITIKLRMDNRVARGASAELTGFKKQLAELTQQWNSLTAAERGSAAGAAIREKFRALRTEAQGYTSTLQAAVKAEDKMRESHSKTEASANKLSSAYHNQGTYLSRLIQRMAAYAGVSYVGNFLTNVREVTAQFELQRISLGAIIQDQQRANQLFEEIKTFALKSPVKILDLTKYTKQLAAYKIGIDELFETTKRLTDISVGLGVSMDRIVLMYGQIRATGYLRASEVRQATEAGIPLVEELAKKLSKANDELVTAADVMDMISKRAISFDKVKEVFDDMTSAGGIFYQMQEKQGNTLFGMWQKLGDAAAVMYDQIGNISSVNEGMKMAIQTLRYLMLHWKQVGIVVGGVSVYILANTIATKNNAIATAAATTANKLHIASLQQKLGALRLEQMNLKSTAIFQRLHTAATISATKAQMGAATSTNVFSKALYGLKAALLSNPLTALAVALTTIIALLMQSESELDKLNSKLQDINRDYDASGKKSVERFKELVKAVEENVDGSKAQKEALDELDRTYGKILGSEALGLDSLKALGGQYGELIELIEAYNAKKKGEERATAIKSSYATILDEEKDDLMDYLNQAGMSAEKQAEFIQAINDKMLEGKDYITATDEAFKEFANDISQLDAAGNILNVLNFDKLADAWGVGFRQIGGWFGGQGMGYLYNYAHALEGQNKALDENEKKTRLAADAMGVYSSSIDGLNKSFANLDWSSMEALYNSLQEYNSKHPENMISVPIDLSFDPAKAETEYDKLLETSNMKINAIFSVLQQIAAQEGQAIPEEFYKQAKSVVEGNKDFSFIDWAKLEEQFKSSPKALAAIRASKQLYESIAPSDDTVRMFNRKFITLADNMDVSLDKMQKYLMKSGDNLGKHRKKLSDEVTNLLKEIARLEWTKKALTLFGLPADAVEEKIQESQQTLKLLQSMISTIPDIEGIGKKKKGGTSDPRLQNLKEEISLTKKLYDEYHKLEKQIGATKAAEKIQEIYSNTIKTLQGRAGKYGFKFELPFTDENLKANMQHFIDKMKELQKLRDKKGKPLFPTIGNDIDAAVAQLEDVDLTSLQKALEKKLKQLADRISRTKTAKEFYEKMLSQTGDVELATRVSLSIYGSTGEELFEDTVKQIREVFKSGKDDVVIDISPVFDMTNQRIDYKMLADIYEKYQDSLIAANKETAKKIAQEGQKEVATNIANWQKELAKAKDFEQQRTDIIRTAAAEREKIIKGVRDPEERKELLDLSREKESQDLAKVNFEEFTKSEDYIKIFENLDNVATSSLKRLRAEMQALIDTNQNLSPENMKTLVKAMEDIDEQISGRGFGNDMIQSVNDYITSIKNLKIAKQELAKAEAEYQAQEPRLDADIETAKAEKESADTEVVASQQALLDIQTQMAALREQEIVDEAQLAALQAQEIVAANALTSAELKQNQAANAVVTAEQAKAKAADKVKKAEQEVTDEQDKQKEATTKFLKDLQQVAATADQLANILGDVKDVLQISEDSAAGVAFDSAIEGLQTMSKLIGIVTAAQAVYNVVTSANPWIAIAAAILAVGSILGSWITGSKVRKANKEIEKQQKLIDQLEYAYSQLEKAADKALGSDFVMNQKQQQKALLAQQEAYMKQYEAEKSKGKKADEEKMQEYLDKARDVGDQIADMQGKIAEQMTGTDVASAARDFANAWLETYATFGNTTDAIKEKFKDLIKSMIVESVMAKTVQMVLQPIFDNMDDMYKRGRSMTDVLEYAFSQMESASEAINNGLTVNAKYIESLGINIRDMYSTSDNLKGISRDIATASEKDINGLAAHMSTVEYYVSTVPGIAADVAAMRAALEGGLLRASGVGSVLAVDYTGMIDIANQHLQSLPRIEQHVSNIYALLNRVVVAKGGKFGVNSFYNS